MFGSSLASLGACLSDPNFHINPPPADRTIRIYCDGIYDVFHIGHAKALEQAKKAFPDVYLMVGVCDDMVTQEKKGKTVMNESERAESLRHCKWVDEVIEHAPWVIDQNFLDDHRIDYVAHDILPYESGDSFDVYHFVKSQGKFLPTTRTPAISTSDIITRIVRDYDQYLRRNLERGVSPKELNISFFKEQELNVKKSVKEISRDIRQNWIGTTEELKDGVNGLKEDLTGLLKLWDQRSQEIIIGFASRFGAQELVQRILSSRTSPHESDADSDQETSNKLAKASNENSEMNV